MIVSDWLNQPFDFFRTFWWVLNSCWTILKLDLIFVQYYKFSQDSTLKTFCFQWDRLSAVNQLICRENFALMSIMKFIFERIFLKAEFWVAEIRPIIIDKIDLIFLCWFRKLLFIKFCLFSAFKNIKIAYNPKCELNCSLAPPTSISWHKPLRDSILTS